MTHPSTKVPSTSKTKKKNEKKGEWKKDSRKDNTNDEGKAQMKDEKDRQRTHMEILRVVGLVVVLIWPNLVQTRKK